MKLRYYIALWIAKLSTVALAATRHNGTNFPGQLAIKICPDFIKLVPKPKTIIGITGTNGKTTVTNMVVDALALKGEKVLNNSFGSNIHYGVATSLLKGSTIFGKCRFDKAVLELDERATPILFPYLKPDILLITNLFRDSMKRNAHTEYIAWILENSIPTNTKLLLNGDDLISSGLCENNRRGFFGIEEMEGDTKECHNIINDMRICPKCHHKLKYEYLRYHHIGKAYCDNCGFKSPSYDYYGKNVDMTNMTMTFGYKGKERHMKLISDGVHNIYNVVSATGLLMEMGLSLEESCQLMEKIKVVGSRYSKELCGEVYVANQMAKENNALGSSRAFDYVANQPGNKELILMMNCLGDAKTWSENTCWLYDCDFEYLKNDSIKKIIVTGPRGKDYHLRLLLAGIGEEKIVWTEDELNAPSLLSFNKGESIYIFYGTDSLALGEKVLDKVKKMAVERGNK